MSTTISTSFVAEYGAGIKLAYQRMSSKLRGTVRLATDVVGSTYTWQKLGTGAATQKSRHGDVPAMNPVHSTATATLADWYAGDYVGYLDEKKIKFDEKQAIVNTGAYALGRRADQLIINALDDTTVSNDVNYAAGVGMDKALVFKAFQQINASDVPDDGERFGVVGAHQWNELLNLTEFKSADYIGGGNLPWLGGTEAKSWLNIKWLMHTGLTKVANKRTCFLYHRTGIGLAEGAAVHSQIDWVADKAEHFANSWMSMGAALIDEAGVYQMSCDDTTTSTLT